MTSINQTTNFVSPNFFHEFFVVWAVEKDNKLFIGPKHFFFSVLDQRKVNFLFQLLNWEVSWKKLVKTRFVVWWFNVTIWLLGFRSSGVLKVDFGGNLCKRINLVAKLFKYDFGPEKFSRQSTTRFFHWWVFSCKNSFNRLYALSSNGFLVITLQRPLINGN